MGSETTTTFLRFLLLYMINFPAEQERLQAELDRVVGRDRAPALADARAGALPYTEAVIAEIQGHISSMTSTKMWSFSPPPLAAQTLYEFCLSTNPMTDVIYEWSPAPRHNRPFRRQPCPHGGYYICRP